MTKGDRILGHGLRTCADGNGIGSTIVIVRLCIDRITDSDAAVMKGTAVFANDQGILFRFIPEAYGYTIIPALIVQIDRGTVYRIMVHRNLISDTYGHAGNFINAIVIASS